VNHPFEVRLLHGELTRRLLLTRPLEHGLTDAEARRVGLLCAHHQGRTCCGRGVPGRTPPRLGPNDLAELADELGVSLVSLGDDARNNGWFEGVEAADRPGRLVVLELLVGVLRVADGADVGAHRVPHFHSRDDYLQHCRQRAVQGLLRELELRAPDEQTLIRSTRRMLLDHDLAALRESHGPHLAGTTGGGGPRFNPQSTVGLLRRAHAYFDALEHQAEHYEKHQMVAAVRFDHMHPDSAGPRWQALVRESSGADPASAVAAVDFDIVRELRHDDGDPKRVEEVLAEFDLRFDGTRAEAR
jgi:hypothetical protein